MKQERKKLEFVLLSNHVIQSWIADLSLEILEQLSLIKASPLKISLQSNETTDVLNFSKLIALVSYVQDGTMKENFFF